MHNIDVTLACLSYLSKLVEESIDESAVAGNEKVVGVIADETV